jgi:hypothetical protein
MTSDAYRAARERYRSAYDAYQAQATRVLEKLESGSAPSAEEIAEEARAAEELAALRRELLDIMASLWPFRP